MPQKEVTSFSDLRVGDHVKSVGRTGMVDSGYPGIVTGVVLDEQDDVVAVKVRFRGQSEEVVYGAEGQAAEPLEKLFRVTDRPEAPSNLVASNPTDTTIELTWTDNSDDEEGFRVQYRTGDDNFDAGYTQVPVGVDEESLIVEGLTPETEYFFRVAAFKGTQEAHSNVVSETTEPEPGP